MSKLEKILNKIEEEGLTAYEISKEVALTEAGLLKMMRRESKPRDSTIQLLDNYLSKRFPNSYPTGEADKNKQLQENGVEYKNRPPLSAYSNLEIVEYIADNLDDFEEMSVFRKVVGIEEVVALRKEVADMRKRFLEIVHERTKGKKV